MKINEFRNLPLEDKLQKANKRLQELHNSGLFTNNLRCDELDFTYKSLSYELQKYGYTFDRTSYQFVVASDIESAATTAVKTARQDKSDHLTLDEIKAVRELLKTFKNDVNNGSLEDLIASNANDESKSATVKIRSGIYEKWQDYCKSYGYYNNQDLITAALVHLMASYPKKN